MSFADYPTALLILFGVAALLALAALPLYFAARKPRRGTTEWMRCIETPHFSPLHANAFRASDPVWAVLAAALAVLLRLSFLLLQAGTRSADTSLILTALFTRLSSPLIPCALTAIGSYLLLRSFCGGKLSSICGAVILSLFSRSVQPRGVLTAAVFVWALLFLWLWVCAAERRGLFPAALWLTFSLVSYSVCIFLSARLVWMCPLWVAAWLYVTLRRRGASLPFGRRAVLSAVWTLFVAALCALAVCGVWLLRNRYAQAELSILLTSDFYREILLLIKDKATHIFAPASPLTTILRTDVLLLLFAGTAFLCSLHGLFRLRDSHELALLLAVVVFAAQWLLGGVYLMSIVSVLALGRLWGLWSRRGQTATVLLYAASLIVTAGLAFLI